MGDSCRFAVAVHMLTILAEVPDRPCTSGQMAQSVNTNPVVLRRVMSALHEAGLIETRPGVGGGARLARPTGAITLDDVYCAVEDDGMIAVHKDPNRDCAIGAAIGEVLGTAIKRAETAMHETLRTMTMADVVASVRKAKPKVA